MEVELLKFEHPNITVALDLGSTKIVMIAGFLNQDNNLEILAFADVPTNSIKHSHLLNVPETIDAIQLALAACKDLNPTIEINEVYVGVSGHHIKSLHTRGEIIREDTEKEISQEEINQLVTIQRGTFIPAGDKIIDIIPQDFTVDNIGGIENPIGFNGIKLSASFHLITADRNAVRNIQRAVERSGLKVNDIVLQPLASAAAVMTGLDLEAGVSVLDIGGGKCDLAIFYEGTLRHIAVIPFGGDNITSDIMIGLGLLRHEAEQLKIEFGSALSDEVDDESIVTIIGTEHVPEKHVSLKNLSFIIQSRMSEIFDFVVYHLKQVGIDTRMLNGGIILTGGGSQLKHLIQLSEYSTGLYTRIGYVNADIVPEYKELRNPKYATAIGIMMKGCVDRIQKSAKSGTSLYQKNTPFPRVTAKDFKTFWSRFTTNVKDRLSE